MSSFDVNVQHVEVFPGKPTVPDVVVVIDDVDALVAAAV